MKTINQLFPPIAAKRLLSSVMIAALGMINSLHAVEPIKVTPLASKVENRISDVAQTTTPSALHINGWLGHRMDINEKNRLLTIEIEPMLEGFQKKPGNHPWIGEHVGKWLHAATLAWANTGNTALRAKIDRVASALISAQEPDGYLGTYVPEKRFVKVKDADWDVWSHKYCLIGLLTYYQYTGQENALAASRRAADLILQTFPGKRSILAAGTHVGMASTSILEPIVLLYRLTGDTRYLDFARYIVSSWDEPKGPAILKSLLTSKRVDKTANAKSYEMLSNLVGLCDLARVTGDRSYIDASLNAWNDISANRLYITGSTSLWEHFQNDHVLFNGNAYSIGETCVTTTWIQFNLSLLQLTGEAKYGDELERSYYNHLTAAQDLEGSDWCYYTSLEGSKRYDSGISCCHSSGPRALALAPQMAYLHGQEAGLDTLLVNTLEDSSAEMKLGGEAVTIKQSSEFPRTGQSTLTVSLTKPASFGIKVRIPTWALPAKIDGQEITAAGWANIPARTWNNGDKVSLSFNLGAHLILGEYGNKGKAALAWGPYILAFDEKLNSKLPKANGLGFADDQSTCAIQPGKSLVFTSRVTDKENKEYTAKFLPFADVGADKSTFRIWLYAPGQKSSADESILTKGVESRSRQGSGKGSINNDSTEDIVTTDDGMLADEDWYAVTLPAPQKANIFSFVHGKCTAKGGWFDSSLSKPKIQIQRSAGAAWETLGELKAYPWVKADGNEANNWNLRARKPFLLALDAPVEFLAVRVIGKPASGNDPKQAYSSCAELQAYNQ